MSYAQRLRERSVCSGVHGEALKLMQKNNVTVLTMIIQKEKGHASLEV